MAFFNPYLAVAVYPLLAIFLGDPVAVRWGVNHGAEPMPSELELRVQRNGRLLWILRYVILACYVLYGLRGITIHKGTPIRSSIVGIAVGAALIVIRYLGTTFWPGLSFQNPTHPAIKGPVGIWATIIGLGGYSEELWRAFCLVAFRHSGSTLGFALLCTSVVFALSELAGRPSRISSRREEVFFTAMVGASLGRLFVAFHSLTMIMSANVVYHGLAFCMLRRLTVSKSANLPQQNL